MSEFKECYSGYPMEFVEEIMEKEINEILSNERKSVNSGDGDDSKVISVI